MKNLKHLYWSTAEAGGRIAVRVSDSGWITIKKVSGSSPPVEILPYLFDFFPLNEIYLEKCRRVNSFAVSKWEGMSGCIDYTLIECYDEEMAIFPTRARLHISMYGKLNDEPAIIDMWLGDFCDIFDAMQFEESSVGEIEVSEAEIVYPNSWREQPSPAAHFQAGREFKVGCQWVIDFGDRLYNDGIWYRANSTPTLRGEALTGPQAEEFNIACRKNGIPWGICGGILVNRNC